MAKRELQAEGTVLATAPSGERFVRLHVVSAEAGRLTCMWRRSSKQAGGGPDLFDDVTLWLEASARAEAWFVREYRLRRRRAGIARRYESLRRAVRLGDLLWRNLLHAEFSEPVACLAVEALDALDARSCPRVVYLKALYRFAREEGYAVAQQWLAGLPIRERARADTILHSPADQLTADDDALAGDLAEKLERWLRGETDILVP